MNRRALSTLALLATTALASAGSASAATFKNPALGSHSFYRDGSVLTPVLPAYATRAEAVAAAHKKKKSTAPVVTKVSPMRLKVGEKLYIYGKNFLPGKGKSRVFFLRVGHAGAAWVRSNSGTKTRLVVTVPASLNKLIPASGQATRFQIRVLTKSFGKATRTGHSPLISTTPGAGSGAGGAGVSGPSNGVSGCVPNFSDPTADTDKDLLPDVREHAIGTDPCSKDSDGDGVSDGYEYYSALDLNSNALPYPAKMPYPNALFPDADVDYDGDGLTLADEFSLWTAFGNSQLPLNYSDGKQTTVATPAPAPGTLANWSLDLNGDGMLNDGERDGDNDGLSNWDESHGRMTHDWWTAAYSGSHGSAKETPYLVTFQGTNMVDADTDGDNVVDGLDDNDFDGYSNMFEVRRPSNWGSTYVSLGMGTTLPSNWDTTSHPYLQPGADPYARVQPFNPCKPLWSAICHQHWPFSYYGDNEDWAAPTPAEILAEGGSAPGTLP
ncbi:MAG: IPT/TIG domain-containing protein [Gaiellaceae bacterium]